MVDNTLLGNLTAADVAAVIVERWRSTTRPHDVVAVDGPSGAGKSTLASHLAAALDAHLVRLDDLYPGWDGLDQGADIVVGEIHRPRAAGRPGRLPRWDWESGRVGSWEPVPADARLVVEGVGAGCRAARPFVDQLVFVTAAADHRRRRALARDGELYRRHWTRWARLEERHFAREATASAADVVVHWISDDRVEVHG